MRTPSVARLALLLLLAMLLSGCADSGDRTGFFVIMTALLPPLAPLWAVVAFPGEVLAVLCVALGIAALCRDRGSCE